MAYQNRGIRHMADREYQQAIEVFSKVIELDTDEVPAYKSYLARGYAYHYSVQTQRAIEDFTKVIQLSPDVEILASAYAGRGNTYIQPRQGLVSSWAGESAIANAEADLAKACELDSEYC
jgi:tetratricopeptide (TPR) repeat protein